MKMDSVFQSLGEDLVWSPSYRSHRGYQGRYEVHTASPIKMGSIVQYKGLERMTEMSVTV